MPFLPLMTQSDPETSALSGTEIGIMVGVFVALAVVGLLVLKKVRAQQRARYEGDEVGPSAEPTPAETAVKAAKKKKGPRTSFKQYERAEPAQPKEEPTPEPEPKVEEEHATLFEGLKKTRKEGFMSKLRRVISKDLSPNLLDDMEEILLTADIGVQTATKMLDQVKDRLSRKELNSGDQVLGALREEAQKILAAPPQPVAPTERPVVHLVIGVNGAGKTTSLGKLAHRATQDGKKVMLVAGDTFRAAAVDQLEVWAQRAEVGFHKGKEGADPASVIFDGVKRAADEGYDLVLCDTAGRLHTNANLISELEKVVRVTGKALSSAPHEVILVLDATIGQNAVHQARTFTDALGVTGIILTKLDGTARGGVVLGISDQLQLPIRDVGVGEKINDLRPFDTEEFLDGLFSPE